MKALPNEKLRQLRQILGLTQAQFAALIGASKDAVASWELGRNPLSAAFARRIAFATGVEAQSLLRASGPLTAFTPGRVPFSAETFARHRASYWGGSDETAARRHLKHCADALGLLFMAASRPPGEEGPCRLPAVVDSFIQWCEQTRKDFQLDPGIEAQLRERKRPFALNQTYKAWRTKLKEDPTVCRLMGFKDDPKKRDEEYLRLEMETVPIWRPGYSMRGEPVAEKPQAESRKRKG